MHLSCFGSPTRRWTTRYLFACWVASSFYTQVHGGESSCRWSSFSFESGSKKAVNASATVKVTSVFDEEASGGDYLSWFLDEKSIIATARFLNKSNLEKDKEIEGIQASYTLLNNTAVTSTLLISQIPEDYNHRLMNFQNDACGTPQTVCFNMTVAYCNKTYEKQAFNQNATILISSHENPSYGEFGTCSCNASREHLYNTSGKPANNQVRCNDVAEWDGCENVQCWSAPLMFGVRQNQKLVGRPADFFCNYTTGFPLDNQEFFFIDGTEVNKSVTLNSSQHLKNYYCQVTNSYTIESEEEAVSDGEQLIVNFGPENLLSSFVTNKVQILVGDSAIVEFSFRANDAHDNVTGTFFRKSDSKHFIPVNNTSDDSAHHCFSYNITVNDKSEHGEYIFIAHTSKPRDSQNISIEVVRYPVTTPPIATTTLEENNEDDSGSGNTVGIAAGCGALGLVIILVVAVIIYRRHKGKGVAEPDIKEERENPLYGSTPGPASNDQYSPVDKNKKKNKKEKEEKVNPLYEGTSTNENMVEEAYAAIDRKKKKGKKDNTGNENSAFAEEVTYAAVNKPKKNKKTEPQPDVIYSAVQKKKKHGQPSDADLHS